MIPEEKMAGKISKPEKRWFITKDGENVHWVQSYIRKYIEYDNNTNHCIVAMENDLNCPDAYGCRIEEIDANDFFDSKKEAQNEIIRRERFGRRLR